MDKQKVLQVMGALDVVVVALMEAYRTEFLLNEEATADVRRKFAANEPHEEHDALSLAQERVDEVMGYLMSRLKQANAEKPAAPLAERPTEA